MLLARSVVARSRRNGNRFTVAVVRRKILYQCLTIANYRSPSDHLVDFFCPGGSGQSLRIDQAKAVTRRAGGLLYFSAGLRCGIFRRETEAAKANFHTRQQQSALHCSSTTSPMQSIALNR